MKGKTFTVVLATLVLLAGFVYGADTGLVRVINLHYRDGVIEIVESVVNPGYFPDRKNAPEEGYKFEIISDTGEILYDFAFKVPLEVYVDSSSETGEMEGGLIRLTETDFALVVPHFENEDEIRILDEKGDVVLTKNVAPATMLGPKKSMLWLFLVLVVIVVAVLWWRRKHREIPSA